MQKLRMLPLFLVALFAGLAPAMSQVAAPAAAALRGDGDVKRTVLTSKQLLGGDPPPSPVDDIAGFALPTQAAEPHDAFEGTLTLTHPEATGWFTLMSDIFSIVPEGDSPWKHLAPFSFQFVQSGSYLIPAAQGLAITGRPAWNYIVGPGRAWQERSDQGYTRASFPFALVQRNQNCVHNGEMTFLFSNSKSSRISHVYYQITQETCYPMKFNMWGVVSATYSPGSVTRANAIREEHLAEIHQRLPAKRLNALSEDFPKSGFNPSSISKAYQHPEDITTYGVVINGVHYSAGCPTRSGEYAFCEDMRLPSYSIAKSVFAGVALMRLGQLYGTGAYSELIRTHIPEELMRGKWEATTFNNASDMATGYFNLDGYEADEDSPAMDLFLIDEAYAAKLTDAFAIDKNHAPPGTKWVYQSSATFVLTQAMNAYLTQRNGNGADIFNMVRDDVYKPLHFSAGGLTTIRTENSPEGAPSGYYGLFFNKDDVAKIGTFLNRGDGTIGGTQVLELSRLREALFRSPNAPSTGVPILGSNPASIVGQPQMGTGKPANSDTRRYAHGFWGKYVTTSEFPEFPCSFWVSVMSGYGGNVIALLPNGVTFYVFSDGREFLLVHAMREAAKLSPMCQ
jgi:CubicO group peptidase (beta-lactamase class C family)